MTELLILVVFALILVFLARSRPLPKPTAEQERARRIGTMVGLTGGSVGEAMIARYALDRVEESGGETDLRDEATAAGGMDSIDD